MAIGFFVALKILFFFILISSQKEDKKTMADVNYAAPSQPYISKGPDGKTLFSQNCASCHALNRTLTGPALAGVLERVPDRKLLYEWIRNSNKVIQSGNPYFVKLYKDFNKTSMNQFPNLTEEEIEAILYYIDPSE